MRGRVINPWDCPAGPNTPHRLVKIGQIPGDCNWEGLDRALVISDPFEIRHMFNKQALIQFENGQIARKFVRENKGRAHIGGMPLSIGLSPIPQLIAPTEQQGRTTQSRVICIQVMKLRVYLGIHDIYEECSHFGKVEKIICFEKSGKFALVQMSTVYEASLVLVNLSNNPRHLPAFQFRVQYSKNQDIVIKFNNSKSFDFTAPEAVTQFAQLRESAAGDTPFFEPEASDDIPGIFDAWRPVHFDPSFTPTIVITGFEDTCFSDCDHFRNLLGQYGPVSKVRVQSRGRKTAYVSMLNGFYARVAMAFLQTWRFDGKPLSFEYGQSVDSSLIQNPGEVVREYDTAEGDFELEEYGALWFPSEYVSVRPRDARFGGLKTVSTFLLDNESIFQFERVEDAARFIVGQNFGRAGEDVVVLRFTQPPRV
jgi:hypothetical protein